ncbi:MAG: HAD hydrolase-like protein [Patescibacteria group bacterium]
MEQIFHKIIIWDFNRTIYDPDARALIKDAMDVLIYAHQKGYKGILFSKNKAGEMPIKEQLNKLAISEYFQAVIESEEKNIKDIKQLLFLYPPDKTRSYLISDRAQTDIPVGNALGFRTVWFKNGKFASDLPRTAEETPLFTIDKLIEFKHILESEDV